MNYTLSRELPIAGFNFVNCVRNREIIGSKFIAPKVSSTGTTIVGIVFRHGVVLGADSSKTTENIITGKRTFKIHRITSNIYCCGSGTAADCENVCQLTSAQIKLLQYETDRQVPPIAAVSYIKHLLFTLRGELRSTFIIGGIHYSGFYIYSCYSHGSTDKVPYITSGSAGPQAMSIIETRWYPNMTKLKAVRLVRDAIKTGIYNDLMSGGCADICIVTKKGVEYTRHLLTNPQRCLLMGYDELNKCRKKAAKCHLKKYTISETVIHFKTQKKLA